MLTPQAGFRLLPAAFCFTSLMKRGPSTKENPLSSLMQNSMTYQPWSQFSFSTADFQVHEDGSIKGNGFHSLQMETSCLSEYTYYIESEGEVAIIDPLREASPYVQMAKRRGAKIKYILETHFHADFVSGHVSLAKETGAQIVFGPTAQPGYRAHVARDGEVLKLGSVSIQVLHTPGHTMESSCFLLKDKKDAPVAVYTGDTLFLGEVGRPDLAVKSGEVTVSDLAGLLFDSLRNKLMTLPGDVVVFPGHGAGSACGKNIGSGQFCNIRTQMEKNYALQQMSQSQFTDIVSANLPTPPQYFFYDAGLNKNGYETSSISDVKEIKPRDVPRVLKEKNAVILDSRKDISDGFITGSLNISIASPFANWVGSLVKPQTNLLVFSDSGMEEETITRLRRIGYDHIVGYFKGTKEEITSAGLKIENVPILPGETFLQEVGQKKEQIQLLDIRTPSEFDNGHLKGSQLLPLAALEESLQKTPLSQDQEIYVYCGTGVRAKMSYGIFERYGYSQIKLAKVGFADLQKAGADVA